jgi:hypothetical protein
MLARRADSHIGDYVSDRVFDGTRPIPPALAAKMLAHHQRKHAKPASRFGWAGVAVVVTFVVTHLSGILRLGSKIS